MKGEIVTPVFVETVTFSTNTFAGAWLKGWWLKYQRSNVWNKEVLE